MVVLFHCASDRIAICNDLGMNSLAQSFLRLFGAGFMAMFFMVSGYGFVSRKWKRQWKTQVKTIIKPYYIASLCIILSRLVLAVLGRRSFFLYDASLIPTHLFGFNLQEETIYFGIPIATISIYWFILALAGASLILNQILRLNDEKKELYLSLGVILLGFGMSYITKCWPFVFNVTCICTGYMYVGKMIERKDLINRKVSFLAYLFMAAVIVISLLFGDVDIAYATYQLTIIDFISTACIGFLLLKLFDCLNSHHLPERLDGVLTTVGFNSMWILLIHGYDKRIVPWARILLMFRNPYVAIAVEFVLRCIIIYLLYRIVMFVKKKMKRKKKKKIKLE